MAPQSPVTPSRKRRSMRILSTPILTAPSPRSSQLFDYDADEQLSPIRYTPGGFPSSHANSRRASRTSFVAEPWSPADLQTRTSLIRGARLSANRLSLGSNVSAGISSFGGQGNLADELDELNERWDDDENETSILDSPFLDSGTLAQTPCYDAVAPRSTRSGNSRVSSKRYSLQSPVNRTSTARKFSMSETPLAKPRPKSSAEGWSPSKQWASMNMTPSKPESAYDGSDHGLGTDDELAIPAQTSTLQRQTREIEELVTSSLYEDNLEEHEMGGIIARTTRMLRDNLNHNQNLESYTTRMVTAYSSIAAYRQTVAREIETVARPILGSSAYSGYGYRPPAVYDLPAETINVLISELDLLLQSLEVLPRKDSQSDSNAASRAGFLSSPFKAHKRASLAVVKHSEDPLEALHGLVDTTQDLQGTLHNLTDTLTEYKQYALTAARKLNTVRDLVETLAVEQELVEQSMILIQAGDWDRRCRERQASKLVNEILAECKSRYGCPEGSNRSSAASPGTLSRPLSVRQ